MPFLFPLRIEKRGNTNAPNAAAKRVSPFLAISTPKLPKRVRFYSKAKENLDSYPLSPF
jgi:hypothetical protein